MRYLHTMVRVADLDAALDFWVGKLGLVETRRTENEAGRFTLVFLAAPQDEPRARAERAPEVELTWNWDAETYTGGRNFGHLAYMVDDIHALCAPAGGGRHDQPPAPRRPHGVREEPGRDLHRTPAEGRAPGARRALGLGPQHRRLVRA